MSDRPIGLADLLERMRLGVLGIDHKVPDHWYWCRQHERAEHISTPTISHDSKFCVGCLSGDHEKPQPCIRIGPFMSEREANLLSGVPEASAGPLGMEVER